MIILPAKVKWSIRIFILIQAFSCFSLLAQHTPGYYRLQLSDKAGDIYSINHPEAFLSQKAILRRNKTGISITEEDLPVSPFYLDSLNTLGLEIYCMSKWFNSVTVRTSDTILLDTLSSLGFILSIDKTRPLSPKKSLQNKWNNYSTIEAGVETGITAFPQLSLNNGDQLHHLGYRGREITIAVIDAGFYHVDNLPAFDSLWDRNQILGTWDFVSGNSEVFNEHRHGMNVLSIIGGLIPGQLTGSAPESDFWLLRSEDAASEYIVEEDLWTSAAEFADSAGADIISSSLGYFHFDDTTQNHTYQEMNGHSTRVAQAATKAAEKGMIVVNSAGNEGQRPWHYIISPADADSILAVGAVDSLNNKAAFSSFGPTSDGRIKPDVCAMGVQDLMQGTDGTLVRGNGTSFSAPVISGLVACLWQAFPDLSAQEIIGAVKQSGDHSHSPDNLTGYGTPDFLLAFSQLNAVHKLTINQPLLVYPNPFYDNLNISLKNNPGETLKLDFFDLTGHMVFSKEITRASPDQSYFFIDGLNRIPGGLLILKISSGTETHYVKLFRYESFR